MGTEFILNESRFVETMQEQAEIGATEGGGLHRLTLSDADRKVRDWFADQCEDAGLSLRVDAFGNMFARRAGSDPKAKPLLVGSHLDSQPYGGIYDGALGVVAALEFIRELNSRDITTRHPIEVVNWTNEEGSRFQPAMQGSGVWADAHDIETDLMDTGMVFAVSEDGKSHNEDEYTSWEDCYAAATTYARPAHDLATSD